MTTVSTLLGISYERGLRGILDKRVFDAAPSQLISLQYLQYINKSGKFLRRNIPGYAKRKVLKDYALFSAEGYAKGDSLTPKGREYLKDMLTMLHVKEDATIGDLLTSQFSILKDKFIYYKYKFYK